MISKKRITGTVMFFALVFCVFAITTPVAYAHPKSLYLVANHHTAQFDAWNINPDGTATYQATYGLTYATDPAGVAIDESSVTLFVTSEFSLAGVELVDATTMTLIGTAPGPTDLAGIAVDDANDIVYAVKRYTDDLYVYDWVPPSTVTLRAGFPINLQGCSGAFGIALDETTGILWVADSAAGVARAYDITSWTEDPTKSFTPVHKPVDIAVDRQRGFVYTVSMFYAAWTPPGTGSTLLSKYDLATGTETTGNLVDQGVGVAVDEVTGYVYVTLSPYGRGLWQGDLEVWNTFTSPWTLVDSDKLSGSPAGICIPQEEVAYNPLGLSKDDGLAGVCVNPGDTITYTISYDNMPNAYDVNNVVLTDSLPAETTFVSATGGGIYDPVTHTVTWSIGTLGAGTGPFSVTLVVTVNSGTPPGTTIVNYATIDSDETPPTTVSESTDVCVLAATIESCDSTGLTQDTFNPAEDVYVIGSGYSPSTTYDIYLVEDVTTWTDQMPIPPRVSGTATSVSSDPSGNILVTPAWSSPLVPGKYDIVVDVDSDGIYDEGKDALDDNDIITEGFFVIPEYWLGTILGLVGCFTAFGVFRISKRKHP